MARFCICGCGKKLISKTTNQTDYDRKFFDKECLKKDRREQLREQRAFSKEQRRCSSCHQPLLRAELWKKFWQWIAESGIEL
jgi:hypothetical protein